MRNKYILEVKYLDNVNRCRQTSIVGVYKNLTDLENAKTNFVNTKKKYKHIFSVTSEYDIF